MSKEEVRNWSAILMISIVCIVWIWAGFKIAITLFLVNGIINILFIIKSGGTKQKTEKTNSK